MKIEYCCKKQPLPDTCHHNLKIDGTKMHVKDTLCQFDKSNIKEAIKDGIAFPENGWIVNCDGPVFCEEL